MNGRYVAYDPMGDLFESFAQQQQSNTSKVGQQQPRNNGYDYHHQINNNGPCAEEYDPTALFDPLGTGSPYNSTTAAALNNAGAQLAATMNRSPASLQYGLFRPSAPCPNPASALQQQQRNNLQQQIAHFQQQQQASLIVADYDPVPLRQSQQQQRDSGSSSRSYHPPQHAQHQQQQLNSRHHLNHHHRLPSSDSLIMPLANVPSGNLFSSSTKSGNEFEPSGVSSCSTEGSNARGPEWLESLKIEVSGLSLEPMTGQEVIERVREKTNDVIKRFLPCVDFLVACQQELRKGLVFATQKRLVRRAYRDTLTPKQFHQKYIAHLGQRFLMSNRHVMPANYLKDAYDQIQTLSDSARAVERQGCEIMKNTFLGGMKDGESWGLRKWLSKHGGALSICTDLELILSACQKLNKELDSTKQLAAMMRPMAKKALERLKIDVPQSYQEISTAHPYLPFFHRLEAALRSMSNFDPEDDDVICLDDSDDEVEEVKPKAVKSSSAAKATPKPPPPARKREPPTVNSNEKSLKRARMEMKNIEPVAHYAGGNDDDGGDDDSDDESDIEIIGVKPAARAAAATAAIAKHDDTQEWACAGCSTNNVTTDSICNGCKMSRDFMNDLMKFPAFEDVMNVKTGLSDCEDNDDDDLEPNAFGFGGSGRAGGSGSGDDSSLILAARLLGGSSGSTSPASSRKGTKGRPAAAAANAALNVDAKKMANNIDDLADVFEIGQQSNIRPRNAPIQQGAFWDGERYANALRLFARIIRMPESQRFLAPPESNGHYLSIIKLPLCFYNIAEALIPENFSNLDFGTGRSGKLSADGLHFWNMWNAQDLFQAIDLVLLNSLAYGKHLNDNSRSSERSATNKIRKILWNGIQDILNRFVGDNKELQKQYQPTRRGETSGFVIHKSRNR